MAKNIACGLNETKDKELIKFMDKMNSIGMNNATLIKMSLYKFMNEYMTNNNLNILLNASSDNVIEKNINIENKAVEEVEKTEEVIEEDIVEEKAIEIIYNHNDEIKEQVNEAKKENINTNFGKIQNQFQQKLDPIIPKRNK